MHRPLDPYLDQIPDRFTEKAKVAAYVVNTIHPQGLDPQLSIPGDAMFLSYKWIPEDITVMLLQSGESFKYLTWNCHGMSGDSPYFSDQYDAAKWLRDNHFIIFDTDEEGEDD